MVRRLKGIYYVLSVISVTVAKTVPLTSTKSSGMDFHWIPRADWQAAPPRHVTAINSAVSSDGATETSASSGVPYVIIHHTATRECEIQSASSHSGNSNSPTCDVILRAIQHVHQHDNGWDDIGYNFLIGGDRNGKAEVFEGRGFNVSGAHTRGYNQRSVGIAFIGNCSEQLPHEGMLRKLKELVSYGVDAGYISPEYKLLGHRQLSRTECPGNTLFNELQKWPHFKENP